jgi:beta-galactosidase
MTSHAPPLIDRRQALLATASAATLGLLSPLSGEATEAGVAFRPGRSQPFDLGWRFHLETGEGFESPDFNDSAWRPVDVPHDWSIEDLPPPAQDPGNVMGPFDRAAKGGTATGFSVGGEGWYRKRFHLPAPTQGRVEILFEGVYMNSDVWLNGHHLGAHPYGYTPFAYDLTPYLAADGDNILAVRVRNLGQNSRWYSGSGIYRHVWLDVLPEQSRISRWGVGVVTRRISGSRAEIDISTRLEDVVDGMILVSRVRDARGNVVSEVSAPAAAEVQQALTLASAVLWSPDRPDLYRLETELRRGNVVLDRTANSFGVRIVEFGAEQGMTLNGVPIKLRGGCIHHDNGLLGAAAFDQAEDRKVRLLRARGFNAVRPSHNPFSPAFLDACDRHGMLVVAETFDAWREPKLPQDYSVYFDQNWRDDLTALVLSARNHPSIVLWSIGNEIPGRNSPDGVATQWQLANEVHRLDPSRPVTAAINGFAGRPVTPSEKTARVGSGGAPDRTSVVFLDVVGYNYKLSDYEADHGLFPNRLFFGSESFPKQVAEVWELTEKSPWLLGDFVWTAMDYLGEAGIGGSVAVPAKDAENPLATMSAWPWVNAFCGDIDLTGQQKAQSLARDVVWGVSLLEIVVRRPVPEGKVEVARLWGWHDEQCSWTWAGSEGKTLTVCAYTAGDRVELQLNGRKVGSRAITAADLKRVEFEVPYEAGVLEAIAFRDGAEIAHKRLVTAGIPTSIRLTSERQTGRAGRGDLRYVALEIVDAAGRTVPGAKHDVQLALSGPANLIAFGSASPFAGGSFQSTTAQTWNGRALAIVRGTGRAGRVQIEARADGLRGGRVVFHVA